MEKNERYFYLPDDTRVAAALIASVPKQWGERGWLDAYLTPPRSGTPVCLTEAGREFMHFGMSFEDARTRVLDLIDRRHTGWVQLVNGAYGQALYRNPAVCHIQLGRWIGQGPEMGERLPRIRLSWHLFVRNAKPGGYDPQVDLEGSGSYEDVAPMVKLCRNLGLKEYEVYRAVDFDKPQPALLEAAE